MARFNANAFLRKIKERVLQSRSFNYFINRRSITIFNRVKKNFIESLSDDEIIAAIKNKTDVDGLDIFGFFGFNSDSSPENNLINFYRKNITFATNFTRAGKTLKKAVFFPTKSDFSSEESLLLPWPGGGNWPLKIESGLPGLSRYLDVDEKGRSLHGIQLKGDIRDEDFTGRPFISVHRGNFDKILTRNFKDAVQI